MLSSQKDLSLIKMFVGLIPLFSGCGRVKFYLCIMCEKIIEIYEHVPVSHTFQEEPQPLIFQKRNVTILIRMACSIETPFCVAPVLSLSSAS